MARIVVGSPNLTQSLLLYPGLGPVMLEQHRRSYATSKKIASQAQKADVKSKILDNYLHLHLQKLQQYFGFLIKQQQ
jgi:hypothetical protein